MTNDETFKILANGESHTMMLYGTKTLFGGFAVIFAHVTS